MMQLITKYLTQLKTRKESNWRESWFLVPDPYHPTQDYRQTTNEKKRVIKDTHENICTVQKKKKKKKKENKRSKWVLRGLGPFVKKKKKKKKSKRMNQKSRPVQEQKENQFSLSK